MKYLIVKILHNRKPKVISYQILHLIRGKNMNKPNQKFYLSNNQKRRNKIQRYLKLSTTINFKNNLNRTLSERNSNSKTHYQ